MPKKPTNGEHDKPAAGLPSRQQRKALIRQLRSEQAGKSVPGYGEYLQKIEQMDSLMEDLSRRDSWGVTPPLRAEDRDRLQEAIREAAMAGEEYLKNVREAEDKAKNHDLKKGIPGVVDQLQGLMANDMQTLGHYDPSMELSLPLLLESARTKTLLLGDGEMDTVGGNQNSRIPLTIEGLDGKKYRGVFTKATYSRTEEMIREAFEKTEADAVEEGIPEEGKAQLRGILGSMREYAKKKYPALANLSDAKLFLYMTELHTAKGDRGGRQIFLWKDFCTHLELDPEVIGEDVIKRFGKRAMRIRNHTNEMINTLDLDVEEGARIDSRNSAMSAVADLLGKPKLLARSTNMRFTDGKGRTQEGTVMDFSKGLDLNQELDVFAQVNDAPLAGKESYKALMQMADLQALDYICGNVDRHAGNMMYVTNDAGEIVGVQGIDNDSSFGSFAKGKEGFNRLPGTADMNCISKSMSDTILKLDPAMLRFVLRGRNLSEREMDYASRRLRDLQDAIRKGREHYKNHPKIDGKTEKPFDKGFLRTVSDEEFKALTMDKLILSPNQKNIFNEVKDWLDRRLATAREEEIPFDPKAKAQAKEKELAEAVTQEQVYSGRGLLRSVRGASKLVEDGEFRIDSLTDSLHGSSPEFNNMADAAKKLARLEQELAREIQRRRELGHDHFSAVEYMRFRQPIAEAKEKLAKTTDLYLNKKMRERRATNLDELRGKNPYEQARIDHAMKLRAYGETHTVSPAVPLEKQGESEGEALEIRVGSELSAEEEARAAQKLLRELHEKHGLAAPEEMKAMDGREFNQTLEKKVAESKRAQAEADPSGSQNSKGLQQKTEVIK